MTTQIVGRDVLFYQKINIYSQIHNDLQYDNAIEALLLFSNNEHTTLSRSCVYLLSQLHSNYNATLKPLKHSH